MVEIVTRVDNLRILIISYGDLCTDGRLRSFIDSFLRIGSVVSITRGEKPYNYGNKVCDVSYGRFIFESIIFAIKQRNIDWIVLDNRKSLIPGLIIRRIFHQAVTIQDCREFYRFSEVEHLSGKIGCLLEKHMMKRADLILVANDERAVLMKEEYRLKEKPLVYENIYNLKYESDEMKINAEKRITKILGDDCIRIVSSSGCNISRTNDVLVRNLSKIKRKVRLYLVGDSKESDIKKIKSIASEDDVNEVVITGRLNQSELKYLISKCDIGVVNYGQYDTNNKYCASGKLYEFIYEGIPIITTTNPPLKRFCDEYKVGISDDSYYRGINSLITNYEFYKNNVLNYIKTHDIDEINIETINAIMEHCLKHSNSK